MVRRRLVLRWRVDRDVSGEREDREGGTHRSKLFESLMVLKLMVSDPILKSESLVNARVESDRWDIRRSRNDGRLLMPQQSPVDRMEPSMLFQLARSALTPESLVLVLAQELLDDALAHGRGRRMVGERDFVAEDVAEGLVSVRTLEGSATVEHLEDEDTHRPPTRRGSVEDWIGSDEKRRRTSRQQTSASLE